MVLRIVLLILALKGLVRWLYTVQSSLQCVSGVDGGSGGNMTIRSRVPGFFAVLRPRFVVNEIIARIPARRPAEATRTWLRRMWLLCWMVWCTFLSCSAAGFVLAYLFEKNSTRSAFVASWERFLLVDRAAATLGVVGVVGSIVFVASVTWLLGRVETEEIGGDTTPDVE